MNRNPIVQLKFKDSEQIDVSHMKFLVFYVIDNVGD